MDVERIVLNRTSMGLILRGEEGRLPADLMWRGTRIANRASAETRSSGRRSHRLKSYEAVPGKSKTRCRVTVRSVTPVAVDRSPLLRSLDAGKGHVTL